MESKSNRLAASSGNRPFTFSTFRSPQNLSFSLGSLACPPTISPPRKLNLLTCEEEIYTSLEDGIILGRKYPCPSGVISKNPSTNSVGHPASGIIRSSTTPLKACPAVVPLGGTKEGRALVVSLVEP